MSVPSSIRRTALFGALLSLVWAPAAPAAEERPGTGVPLEDCFIAAPGSHQRLSAECGSVTVPEDPSAPDGRSIELRVAVVRALSRQPAADPLVFITGGPGQAATESYPGVAGAFNEVRLDRDILLVDQRGTGESNPLDCPIPEDERFEDPDPEATRELATRCLEELDADPRFYTTSVAVDDLERVREAMGYGSLNLYGVSYGTRVALHYLRTHPDSTRSVILDGVVPMDLALGPDISLDAQKAVDLAFRRCAEQPACHEAFPQLPLALDLLGRRLDSEPAQVELRDPVTAEKLSFAFTRPMLAQAVRLLSYTPETVALLPLLIYTADQTGDFAPLASQALMQTRAMEDSFSIGMHNAVVCTEDVPFYDQETLRRSGAEETYMGAMQLDALLDICDVWPQGVLDEGFKEPVVSDKPVLLLSGEADPVTPPTNAERAAETLSNSLHLVGAGQGHSIIARGCVPRIVEDFVSKDYQEEPDVSDLDTDCIEDLRAQPFFLRFTGPDP